MLKGFKLILMSFVLLGYCNLNAPIKFLGDNFVEFITDSYARHTASVATQRKFDEMIEPNIEKIQALLETADIRKDDIASIDTFLDNLLEAISNNINFSQKISANVMMDELIASLDLIDIVNNFSIDSRRLLRGQLKKYHVSRFIERVDKSIENHYATDALGYYEKQGNQLLSKYSDKLTRKSAALLPSSLKVSFDEAKTTSPKNFVSINKKILSLSKELSSLNAKSFKKRLKEYVNPSFFTFYKDSKKLVVKFFNAVLPKNYASMRDGDLSSKLTAINTQLRQFGVNEKGELLINKKKY